MNSEYLNHFQIAGWILGGMWICISTTCSVIFGMSLKKANALSKRMDLMSSSMSDHFQILREQMTMKADCAAHALVLADKLKIAIADHRETCRNRRSTDGQSCE